MACLHGIAGLIAEITWVIGLLRAFVAGGVGFHGLNRGVFSQMVPPGHEAEFFGAYFVAIKVQTLIEPNGP